MSNTRSNTFIFSTKIFELVSRSAPGFVIKEQTFGVNKIILVLLQLNKHYYKNYQLNYNLIVNILIILFNNMFYVGKFLI